MRFISHIYHDGSIGKNNKQPHYRNYSKKEYLEFLKDSQNIFGNINRRLEKNKGNTYSVHLPTIIGEIMIAIGYTKGDKTKQNPPTFKFLNYIDDKKLISEYLAKAFNDDGFVGSRTIGIQQASLIINGIKRPSNVLLINKSFLEKLNIKVSRPTIRNIYKNRYGTCTSYVINVYSKENLRLFNNHITLIDYKEKKLKNFLDNGYKSNQ